MEFFTFVDLESARLIRKAYIDSLISSMIRLETDPHVVVWIDRLKLCRERDWDEEVRDIIRNAILAYNTRWTILYGGKEGGRLGLGDVAKQFEKFGSKALRGVVAAVTGETTTGTTSSLVKTVTEKALGTTTTAGRGSDENDLQAALRAELERMADMESMIGKYN